MKPGQIYTRDEVVEMVGAGGDDYILTKNGKVQAITLNPEMNSKAQRQLLSGKGLRFKKAHLLIESKKHYPTFIKCKPNQWEYVGKYKAIDFRSDNQTIESHKAHGKADSIYGILFLGK